MQYQVHYEYNITGTFSDPTDTLTYRVTSSWDLLQTKVRSYNSLSDIKDPWFDVALTMRTGGGQERMQLMFLIVCSEDARCFRAATTMEIDGAAASRRFVLCFVQTDISIVSIIRHHRLVTKLSDCFRLERWNAGSDNNGPSRRPIKEEFLKMYFRYLAEWPRTILGKVVNIAYCLYTVLSELFRGGRAYPGGCPSPVPSCRTGTGVRLSHYTGSQTTGNLSPMLAATDFVFGRQTLIFCQMH